MTDTRDEGRTERRQPFTEWLDRGTGKRKRHRRAADRAKAERLRADPSGEVGEEDVDAIADVLLSRIVTGWRTAYIGSAWRKAEVSIQGIEGAEREWAERAAREILARLRRTPEESEREAEDG